MAVHPSSRRDRIELGFERLGRSILRHRAFAIALPLLLAIGLSSQVPGLRLETSPETFLHPDDPIRVAWEDFQDQFGRDEAILVLVSAPDVFDPGFLARLKLLHEEIEREVPHLHDVDSLINARSTRGNADELIVEDLFEDWPETAAEFAALKARALANPLYRDLILSADARRTSIMIRTVTYADDASASALEGFDDDAPEDHAAELLSSEAINETVDAIMRVVERSRAPDFEIVATGTPVMTSELVKAMTSDMAVFLLIMMLTICIVLFALFRRVSGVVLPLFVVLLSISSTIGVMALAGISLNLPTQILPSFLLAVSTGAAVHILTIAYQRIDAGIPLDEAIPAALGHSGLAVLMTGVTTAGGLLSFSVAELAPIAHLGVLAPFGILLGTAFCLTLLPALLSLWPVKPKPYAPMRGGGAIERVLVGTGAFSVRHPWPILAGTAVLCALALYEARGLSFSNNFMHWFPEGHSVRTSAELVDREFSGSMSLEVVIDSGSQNGLHDPVLLSQLDDLHTLTQDVRQGAIRVGKSNSYVDVLKEIHQALNENRSEFYTVPDTRELAAQELLLFENSGSDDLEDLVDSQFQIARFTLRVPYVDPVKYVPFIEAIEGLFRDKLGEGPTVLVTGMIGMMARTIRAVMRSMARSYVFALLIITPLMILLIGNLRAGLASMVPNLAPIVMTLGLMGALDMAMDTFTLMVGGIAIGLAVDDTIHFIHNFRRYYERSGDADQATRETLKTTGHALLITSVVLAAGFLVYTLSSMGNLRDFGFLIAFCVAGAFVLDMLVSPALMALTLGRSRVASSPAADREFRRETR